MQPHWVCITQGPPPSGRDIRVRPCPLALGWIWLMSWAWSAWQLPVQRLWRQGAPGLLSGSENLLGPQTSSGLQKSPSERRTCSLASGRPDVCLLDQGSSLRSRCGRLKPPFFIHPDCQPQLLWASLPTPYTRRRAPALSQGTETPDAWQPQALPSWGDGLPWPPSPGSVGPGIDQLEAA